MVITDAKRELYQQLRKKNVPVTGAGIKQKNGAEVIVIFVSGAKEKRNPDIPADYKGNKVIIEVSDIARAM